MSGKSDLILHLEELIRRRGPIAFSDYMETVLYHPDYGYYSTDPNPIGPQGDFYTASSLDPAMGHLLAKLFGEMAEVMDRFQLVEIGAGTGLLARHILETRSFPYTIIERSPSMRRRQQETLAGFGVTWPERLPDEIAGCVFSIEFFDALPVKRFVRRGGKLLEIFIAEGLSEREGTPEVALELPLLREGCRADVCLEARDWVRKIGSAIRSGYHLTIDYGYERPEFYARPRGTLMCYRRHRVDEDPYSDVGEKDLTAHVNFTDLIEAGSDVELELVGFESQMKFLIDLGLLEVIQPLAERQDAASIRRLQALKNLLLPSMMGERFRVLLQRKGLPEHCLSGFRRAGQV